MSVLKTIPEELIAAAAQLKGLATSLTAQTAGAAAPTTAVAPAAADSVSILQSAVFSSYGSWYQQIAAEAQSGSAADRRAPWGSTRAPTGPPRPPTRPPPQVSIQQRELPAFNNIATFLGGPGNGTSSVAARSARPATGPTRQLREWQLGLGHVRLPRHGRRRPDPVRRPGQLAGTAVTRSCGRRRRM